MRIGRSVMLSTLLQRGQVSRRTGATRRRPRIAARRTTGGSPAASGLRRFPLPESIAVMMRDRAVLATGVSFTITDPHQPDDPLVWVNPAFTATTGYGFDEAVGAQLPLPAGPGDRPRVVAEIGPRAARRAADHGDAAELPQGRHAVLERAVDLADARRRGR